MADLTGLLQAAAGVGGAEPGEAAYIEDSFSTYLYTGSGATKIISNGMELGSSDGDSVIRTTSRNSGAPAITTLNTPIAVGSSASFTFEGFFYVNGTDDQIFGTSTTTSNLQLIRFNNSTVGSGSVNCYLDGGSLTSTTGIVPINTWCHIAVVRNGTATVIYVDGVSVATATTTNSFSFDRMGSFYLSGSLFANDAYGFTGYVSNVRFSNSAVYTSDFSPPSSALSIIGGTQLLCFQAGAPFTDVTGNSTLSTQNLTTSSSGPFPVVSADGGLVWIKSRSAATDHYLFDTERGVLDSLSSNTTNAEAVLANSLTSFNSNGFNLGSANGTNASGGSFASWTFRKTPKFFDCVTYAGDGVVGRTISHNLGSVPGCMIVKGYSQSGSWWIVYHRSLGATKYLQLSATNAEALSSNTFNDTEPNSSVFTVGGSTHTNGVGNNYVVYLFAHNAGGFGDDGTENVISCGSFTTNGSGFATVDLGYEPQWVLFKKTSATGSWGLLDTMRGWTSDASGDKLFFANTSDAENASTNYGNPTATGFELTNLDTSQSFIYIAIRRGPMRTPTNAAGVFNLSATTSTTPVINHTVGFPLDFFLQGFRTYGISPRVSARLTGDSYSSTAATSAFANGGGFQWDLQDKFAQSASIVTPIVNYFLKRAPGFMDVVCFTAPSSGSWTVPHNLGVQPELVISKRRDATSIWPVTANALGNDGTYLQLESSTNTAFYAGFQVASATEISYSSGSWLSNSQVFLWMFATLAGVSKVGSYTGTGTTLAIDCGFSAGARFVLIKRTDSSGDWYLWDSARGIVAGNDPYLLLNSSAAEVTNTDYVDTSAAGFEISSSAPIAINASGGTFIFLAIA